MAKLARFDNYLLGEDFSAADIAATIHVPVVRAIAKGVLAWDPFAEIPGLAEYLARMEERPTVQQIRADQRADQPHFYAHLAQQRG